MNKYIQILICILLGAIVLGLWKFPGRYQISTVEYASPFRKSSTVSVLLDTSTGRIRKLTQFDDYLIWWSPEPTKSTWESWNTSNPKQTTTNSVK